MAAAPIDPDAIVRQIRRLYPNASIERLLAMVPAPGPGGGPSPRFAQYRNRPVDFIEEVLGVALTPDQEQIANSMARGGRVKVNSGHNVGKTFLAACLVLWWFYTRDPAVVITTAPTERDVYHLLWTEIRLLHNRARVKLPNYFTGPVDAKLRHHDEHWAVGYTARKGESFQGRHRPNMFFIFDESEGVEANYWLTTNTMYQPDPESEHGWFAIGNPTTTSSQSYLEDLATGPDGQPKWRLFTLSALNHPNVIQQLRGERPRIPNAVTLGQVEQYLKDWTVQVAPRDRKEGDFDWPPPELAALSGRPVHIYRPGPSFKSRVMGVRPTEGVDTVWSSALFSLACKPKWTPTEVWRRHSGIQIGLDAAGYGDDDTAVHVRAGPLSLHHEAHNGWGPGEAAGRLKELCGEWAAWYNRQGDYDRPGISPADVDVTIEFDGGYGIGVHSHAGEEFPRWRGVTVGAASNRFDPNGRPMYANVRAEMWFEAAAHARAGWMDLSRLQPDVLDRLRIQLLTPFYENRPNGARLVESKKDVKERLGRSPDDADGLIISHFVLPDMRPTLVAPDDPGNSLGF